MPAKAQTAPAVRRELVTVSPPEFTGVEPDIRVAFVLCPKFTLLPFAAFVDSLRHAADEADYSRQIYCTWKVVAEDINTPVVSSCGVEVLPQDTLGDLGKLNFLVVAGGLLPDCLDVSGPTSAYIRAAYDAGVTIVGLCTGSFVLAEIGLLDGRRCAVHAEHLVAFRSLFPAAKAQSDEMFVSDRGVLTCLGGTSALDLAFHIIEMHCGRARAIKGLTSLLIDRHRSMRQFRHRPHAQLYACGNRKVEVALEIMERHLTAPYSITKLANKAGCSERELSRLFKKYGNTTPSQMWRNMRMAYGHWLLLNSSRSIAQIAYECGFADTAHFTRWFKVQYGQSPHAFRLSRKVVSK